MKWQPGWFCPSESEKFYSSLEWSVVLKYLWENEEMKKENEKLFPSWERASVQWSYVFPE